MNEDFPALIRRVMLTRGFNPDTVSGVENFAAARRMGLRTVQSWLRGEKKPRPYIVLMLEELAGRKVL